MPASSAFKTLPQAIFFDLDGTLVDSAPDLAKATNMVLKAQGREEMPLEVLRPYAGAGARGMLGKALQLSPSDACYPEISEQFFQNYLALNNAHTFAFDGIAELLSELRSRNIIWGIVTNKASRFTKPLVETMPLLQSAASIISGDTTAHTKPHPAPLFAAAEIAKVKPENAWYVGDDKRDIDAAHAAGMRSIAANWGYMGEHHIDNWNAGYIASHPNDILSLLDATE